MSNNELLALVTELRGLKNMATELQDEIDALEFKVKNEMNAQGVDKLFIGDCQVTWKAYSQNKFDTKSFKAEHKDLYEQYTKPTTARRFSIS